MLPMSYMEQHELQNELQLQPIDARATPHFYDYDLFPAGLKLLHL